MWRLSYGPLERLGRLRLSVVRFFSSKVKVGNPAAPDALGTTAWRDYLTAERLYDVWGPVPGSPWVPFHCVPLFAAVDRIPKRDIGPTPPPAPGAGTTSGRKYLPPHVRPGSAPPPWISRETWTIVDLPGPTAVEVAVWLITSAGCQPVCTFDNWPHAKGLLRPEETLAELLRWASTVAQVRGELFTSSPPLWICDSERLGGQPGRPGQFDNRYYLDDSILPGLEYLRKAGIREVVYLTLGSQEIPIHDLQAYFAELQKGGLPISVVHLANPALEAYSYVSPPTPRRPPRTGFRRSSAGGFGTEVPEPSEGSSSSG